ncbi:MAG: hypothetical protein KC731_35020 [Myxococcales bacterium]|nr:hypothetical protein [Myxococcales bacterium]
MFRCACCHREVSRRGRCDYCRTPPEAGGCVGLHGERLRLHLEQQVADGAFTEELAGWWLERDERSLARRVGR